MLLVTNEPMNSGSKVCTKCSDLVATELLGDAPVRVLLVTRDGGFHFERTDSNSGPACQLLNNCRKLRKGHRIPRDETLDDDSVGSGNRGEPKIASVGLTVISESSS